MNSSVRGPSWTAVVSKPYDLFKSTPRATPQKQIKWILSTQILVDSLHIAIETAPPFVLVNEGALKDSWSHAICATRFIQYTRIASRALNCSPRWVSTERRREHSFHANAQTADAHVPIRRLQPYLRRAQKTRIRRSHLWAMKLPVRADTLRVTRQSVGLNPTLSRDFPCAQLSNSASRCPMKWPRQSGPRLRPANTRRRAK